MCAARTSLCDIDLLECLNKTYVFRQDFCPNNIGGGLFSVVTKNVKCGTTGITCSKSVIVSIKVWALLVNICNLHQLRKHDRKLWLNQGRIQGNDWFDRPPPPLKPRKVTSFTMILCNSENSIRDIRQFASIVLLKQSCEVYFISLTVVNL